MGLFVVLNGPLSFAADRNTWTIEHPLVFTDESVQISASTEENREVEVSILTRRGWQLPVRTHLLFQNGKASFRPSLEGIYRIRSGEDEIRFLAIQPPPRLDQTTLATVLPRSARRLVSGKTYTILAMGDSVTDTGDYPEMLAMMLRRTTGSHVVVEKRDYPGKSVDASVRRWKQDTTGIQPDLGLIMFGLNDQAANVPLAAYLEQTKWLIDRLSSQCNADTILLEPTPHIDILSPAKDGTLPPAASIFRVIGYARALADLARDSNIPVAPTFASIWGEGAEDLPGVARALYPLYPVNYRTHYSTLLESGGKGDTIHPNALGHLQLARAVYQVLLGRKPVEPLAWKAETFWEDGQLISKVEVRNSSELPREGRLDFFPVPMSAAVKQVQYRLKPGESMEVKVPWPGATKLEALRTDPLLVKAFKSPGPYLQALDSCGGKCFPHAIAAPWNPDFRFLPRRAIVGETEFGVEYQAGSKTTVMSVKLPLDQEAGRIPLEVSGEIDGRPCYATAELAFVRFAHATSSEAVVDGDLSEWQNDVWQPLTEPVQARSSQGPKDLRASPEECAVRWSIRGGKTGVYIAVRAGGEVDSDTLTVYFDGRPPEELGTCGPYTWVSVNLKNEKPQLRAGDSSPVSSGLEGAMRRAGESTCNYELYLPYPVLGLEAWPASGDLGLSLNWAHKGPDQRTTWFQWAENGHPWNTRWYGVARLNPQGALPYRVRVE